MNAVENALESAIIKALNSEGEQADVNRVYLEFIKANFIIPVEKNNSEDASSAEPKVLFYVEDERIFMPVFTNQNDLDQWAAPIVQEMQLLKLSGVDLLKGIGDEVIVALNLTGPTTKCFLPEEIARMRSMVLKFFG